MSDYIFRKPYILLTASWLCSALLIVFDTGDWTLALIFASLSFLITFIAWLVMIIRALIARRLWYSISVSVLGIFSLLATFFCLRFSDQIHFEVVRPIYLAQIDFLSKQINEKDLI